MIMDPLSDEARTKRRNFFKIAYGRSMGYVCIATLTPSRKFDQQFYRYPEDLEPMLDTIEATLQTKNVYFCPQLFSERHREKEYVAFTPNAWADLDFCHPDKLLIEPTVVLESSPGRFQALWCFDKDVDADDAEDLSRRIAYKHADQGADRSGWDLTQLLRVPYTYNFKHPDDGGAYPIVDILAASNAMYRLPDFLDYPDSPDYKSVDMPMPEPATLPQVDAEQLLQDRRSEMNPRVWGLFTDEPPPKTWSQALWNLEMLLFETNFSREEVFVICQAAKCNKYARDGRPVELLWKDVCRAEQKAIVHHKLLVGHTEKFIELLSEEETAEVENSGSEGFVERYIRWASSLGDAAPQYHQAGAFVVLSSLLAGSVMLPTSYGTIVPNIWFMILADTTLTRKTTAMDIAMDLVMEVDDDVVMATDGSLEGLLTSLAGRPGRPSVFLRDEFSGLLEAMTKKDYMAGMPEMLTKLYDGKMQKRILRKEVIEVRDPRLIFFAGGIKNKITSLLSFEHVSSGFMPRFVFITAESDLNRIKPIGPPVQVSTGERDSIRAELQELEKHYNRVQPVKIEKLRAIIEQKVVFEATMTQAAWIRYNELEAKMLEIGLNSDKPEIMTPIGDRLSKSILKAALLMAAAEQRDDKVVVDRIHLLRAITYGQQWRVHGQEVMDNVGKNTAERQIDNVLQAIRRTNAGCSRSTIMQTYHLNARDANQLFETLEQRGLIIRQRTGRTELLIPVRERD